ncbi:MAG: B12-binding domain-containing radical SAM protein [Myxococcales bacterium]|nr:B12-binding domain-containing radical SAM protein [Myxococcales bacterium]
MKVLLAHGYTLAGDPREQEIMRPFPPLGLQYLAAFVGERAGHDVVVWDPTFGSLQDWPGVLDRERPDVVGMYGHTITRPLVRGMVAEAKGRGIPVVAGGPDPVQYLDEYLAMGVDVVVIGEGEHTFAELIAALDVRGSDGGWDRGRLGEIAGIAFLDQSGVSGEPKTVVRTASRALVKKLDELPRPRRQRADIDLYFAAWRARHGQTAMSLTTSRGCPYHCTWCSKQVYGDTFRRREPDAVIDEMQAIREAYNPDQLWFVDDMFTINRRWVHRFCDRMVERKATVPFYVIGRPETLDAGLVADLRAAGCYRMYVSAESGAQHVLDAMKKESTVEDIERGARLLRSAGIELGVFTMLGYPGEEKRDILATRDLLRRILPEVTLLSVAHPMKGTAFHTLVQDSITGEQAGRLTFEMRHSPALYDTAQRMIWADQDLRRALAVLGKGRSPSAIAGVLRAAARYPLWRARFTLQT